MFPSKTRLQVQYDPPKVVIGDEDVTPALDRILIEGSGGGFYAQVTLNTDVEFDFPTTVVVTTGNVVDVTAEEIDSVILTGGAASSPGQRVMALLKEKGLSMRE
jgi:hypothetical protein